MKRMTSSDVAVPVSAGDPATGGVPAEARRPLRELMDDRLLDALLERSRDSAGGLRLTVEGSMPGELIRAVLERALEAEPTAHRGYARGERGGVGPVPLQVPRDRVGSFEPVLVPKRAGRVAGGLDDMVISLYAHGQVEPGHHLPPSAGLRDRPVARDGLRDHRRRAGKATGRTAGGPAA
jgi:hypothetical protein